MKTSPSFLSPGLLLALPVFAATILICATLASWGWGVTAMVLAVLIGLGFVTLVLRSVVLALGGMVLCVMAGILASAIETPLFGGTVRGIGVEQVGQHPQAAIYHFRDGRVLSEAGTSVLVFAGGSKERGHVSYELGLAPIVGDGWTPDRPIAAWAITSDPNADMPKSDWKGPGHSAVRAPRNTAEIAREMADTARRHHLIVAKDVVLLHWLDDPEAAMASQYRRLITVFCVCAVVWGLMIAGVWIAARRSGSAARARAA